MKKTLLLSSLALLCACAGSSDGKDDGATIDDSGSTSSPPWRDANWFLRVDGEPEISGSTTSKIELGYGLTILFASTAGSGQLTLGDVVVGEEGTFAENVTTQLSGFPGAPNCGWTQGPKDTVPPMEVVVIENNEDRFEATFTFTDMHCSELGGDGEAPNATGSGEVVVN